MRDLRSTWKCKPKKIPKDTSDVVMIGMIYKTVEGLPALLISVDDSQDPPLAFLREVSGEVFSLEKSKLKLYPIV